LHKSDLEGVLRTLSVALFLTTVSPLGVHAFDVPPPGKQGKDRVSLDSSFDTARGGSSLDLNATFALFGTLEESGLRSRLTLSGSWYDILLDPALGMSASGRALEGDALIGYGVVVPRISMIGLVGPAVVWSEDAGVNRERRGLKSVFSLFARPTDETMAYTQVIYSTLSQAYQAQAKVGMKIPLGLYLGPEAKFSGQTGGNQTRVGAHASGINIGPLVLSLSGGILRDQQLGRGQYFSVNVYTSF
jgi:hypothetical protein